MIRKSMKFFNIIPTFALIISLLVLSNCGKEEITTEFQIYVDSVVFEDTIQAGNTLDIEFFGTIGTNGCFSFERFDTEFIQNSVYIKLIGKNSGASVCPDGIVLLDGEDFQIVNLNEGEFILKIVQPDGTELVEKVVVVEE